MTNANTEEVTEQYLKLLKTGKFHTFTTITTEYRNIIEFINEDDYNRYIKTKALGMDIKPFYEQYLKEKNILETGERIKKIIVC
jgi:hypothetical protein